MTEVSVPVCVRLSKNNQVILKADDVDKIIRLEGNWYFHPSVIDPDHFKITDRLYSCPYKGTCNWVDFEHGKLYLPDVAWTYPETLPGYEHIAGWYGFYPGNIYYKTGDCN